MTTTELIELLKKYERGGATGRPREVMFEVDDRIIDTDGIEVTGSGDGLITELYLSLPSAQPEIIRCKDCKHWKSDEFIGNNDVSTINLQSYPCKFGITDAEWYCAYAERRQDD
jgi:hypothetical protein